MVTRLHIQMADDLKAQLAAQALAERRTITALVIRAVRLYLADSAELRATWPGTSNHGSNEEAAT